MSKLGTNPTPKMNFYPEYVPATRPAAPVEGLETVGYVTTSPTGAEVFQRKPLVPGHGQFGYKQDAVVTRSQADELLAAERAETMRQVKHWSELYKQQHYRAEKAEAIITEVQEALRKMVALYESERDPGDYGFQRPYWLLAALEEKP